MKRQEILDFCKTMAMSQGFYGRLHEQLVNNDEALTKLEAMNFKDPIDFVMFVEG